VTGLNVRDTKYIVIFSELFCVFHTFRFNYLEDRGGPEDFETSRLPYFLDNRFTDGSEILSLTRHTVPVTGHGGP
jgi:hypothetical protein